MLIVRLSFKIVLLALTLWSAAQTPGFYFLDGWTADSIYEYQDSIITIGVNRDNKFGLDQIQIVNSNKSFSSNRYVNFNFDTAVLSSSHTAYVFKDQRLFFSGFYKNSISSDSILGFVATFDL